MRRLIFFGVILISGRLYADEFISVWMGVNTKFKGSDQIAVLSSGRSNKEDQPIAETKILAVRNTDYFTLNISTQTNEENDLLLSLESAGSLIKIQSIHVFDRTDPRNGATYKEASFKTHNKPPQEWDWDWTNTTVKRSTP